MPTAFLLVIANQTPLFVLIVQQGLVRIERFLVRKRRVVHVLTVQHIDIAIVYQITQYTQTGVPFQVLVDRALDISCHADQVAFIFIEHTRAVVFYHHFLRFLRPVVPGVVIARVVAVKAVEVAHGIRQIGRIQRQTVTRNKVLRVVVEAEDSVMFGRVSSLDIQRVDILRILRTVAVVIDIRQHTTLEAIVGIVGY